MNQEMIDQIAEAMENLINENQQLKQQLQSLKAENDQHMERALECEDKEERNTGKLKALLGRYQAVLEM